MVYKTYQGEGVAAIGCVLRSYSGVGCGNIGMVTTKKFNARPYKIS